MTRFGINLDLVLIAIAAVAGGCAPQEGPLVGSDARDMEMYMIDDATDVTVSLPLHARLHAGEPGQVRIEGEDNLIALIAVEDFGEGRIEISAPADLGEIRQNQPIDLFIPLRRHDAAGDGRRGHHALGRSALHARALGLMRA